MVPRPRQTALSMRTHQGAYSTAECMLPRSFAASARSSELAFLSSPIAFSSDTSV